MSHTEGWEKAETVTALIFQTEVWTSLKRSHGSTAQKEEGDQLFGEDNVCVPLHL